MKVYPWPGTWSISFTNIRRTSWTLILEPFAETIEIIFPFKESGKSFLFPSINFSILSNTWSWPTDHPVNSSLKISSIVIWNSENDEVVGIPVDPPTGMVKISPFPNPYPVFLNTKSITLDPWPTTISTTALVPTPTILDVEYCRGIFE